MVQIERIHTLIEEHTEIVLEIMNKCQNQSIALQHNIDNKTIDGTVSAAREMEKLFYEASVESGIVKQLAEQLIQIREMADRIGEGYTFDVDTRPKPKEELDAPGPVV